MRFRNLTKYYAVTAVMLAVPFAGAQDSLESDVEQLPNKKLEQRGERIKGPITSITAAGLLFATFDKNADYQIDTVELAAGKTTSFKAADSDKSGTLSLFELEDWRKAALGSFDAAPGNLSFDKDYDQRVTSEEFEQALNYVFKVSDKNEDGSLSFEEMIRVFEMPRRSRPNSGANGQNGNRPSGQQGQRPNRQGGGRGVERGGR